MCEKWALGDRQLFVETIVRRWDWLPSRYLPHDRYSWLLQRAYLSEITTSVSISSYMAQQHILTGESPKFAEISMNCMCERVWDWAHGRQREINSSLVKPMINEPEHFWRDRFASNENTISIIRNMNGILSGWRARLSITQKNVQKSICSVESGPGKGGLKTLPSLTLLPHGIRHW